MTKLSTEDRIAPNQRRLWRVQCHGGVYSTASVIDLDGKLDIDRLQRALGAAIHGSDTLCSVYSKLGGAELPRQVRCDVGAVTVAIIDADARSERGEVIREIVERALRDAFDLASAPLLRASLVRFGGDDHALVLTLPSLSTDAQALCRLAEVILAHYSGQEPESAELEYAQYASWQNDIVAERDGEATAFWAKTGFNTTPALVLPFQRARRTGPFTLGHVAVRFGAREAWSRTLPAELRSISRRWGVEPSSVLMAAWAALVWRWTGAEDVLLGHVEAARAHAPLRCLQGLVTKTIPVLMRVEPDMTLQQLALAVEAALLPARDWVEHFSWDTQPDADAGQGCYFSAAFEYQDARLRATWGELDARVAWLVGASDQFTIKLSCVENERGVTCDVLYDAGVVDAASAEIVARALADFVASLVRRPDAAAREHTLPADAASARVIGSPLGRAPRTVVEMVEGWAAQTPAARALAHGDRNISYDELNASANRLARSLRSEGVKAETVVAIVAERSVEAVISILATLKAGGTFLPVDPEYPAERIAHMLEDSGAMLTLGAERHRGAFSAVRFVALDAQGAAFARESSENLHGGPDPSALAYIIYTSGSTGRPKGCQIEVRNLSHYVSWANEHYFGDSRVEGHFGLFTSLSADLTLMSLFCPLTRGKTLRIYDSTVDTLDALRDMFGEQSDVDVVNLTPSHILIVGTLGLARSNMRMVVTGGEQLTQAQVDILRALNPSIEIHNEYGPTEATVGCLTKRIGAEDDRILIGRPIAEADVFLVDERGALAPLFVAGELFVAGTCVARGYVNAPALTAEKFVSYPGVAGKAYRTGDKARLLASGEFEYLGRVDDQVKVRGHRIEPGEIEQHLLRQPGIHAAHVMARSIRGSSPELAAYLVGSEIATDAGLREALSRSLPAYMVPTHFVRLAALPLTTNGKVNKAALPEPSDEAARSNAIVAPRDTLEESIAAVFRKVLGVASFSVHDDFFELGGHSLKAMQAVGLVGADLGVRINLREFLAAPTVAQIAELTRSKPTEAPVVIPAVAAQDAYELSDAQRRLWILEQMDQLGSAFNMAAAFIFEGEFDPAQFARSFAILVQRHEPLRTSFHLAGGAPQQRVHEGSWVPSEIIEIAAGPRQAELVSSLVTRTVSTPFDLEQGSLFRLQILRLSSTRHIFVLAMHHLLGDGWAVAVLTSELMRLYACGVSGKAPALPPLKIQYKDYAHWRKSLLEGAEAERHARYWREKLSGPLPTIDLPSSKARPALKTYSGSALQVCLDRQTTDRLHALARRHGATLFMVLIGAVNALLYRATGQEDLVVGTVVAGREHPDLEHLIGICINMVVLRNTVSGPMSFEGVLSAVKTCVTEALDHADYPFDRLADELSVGRDVSRSPLFDILVVLQNTEAPTLSLDGVTVSSYPIPTVKSVYDMSLEFSEEEGQLQLDLHYNTDLFNARAAQQLADRWTRLVHGLLAAPSEPLDALPMLSADEVSAAIVSGGRGHAGFEGALLNELIEETIARRPAELAVVCDSARLSYAELNRRANGVARRLLLNGPLPPESVVAVLLPRTEDLPAAFLGVLKAGAIYLPIDADYPVERVTYMLRDSKATAVLTNDVWAGRLHGEPHAALIDIAQLTSVDAAPVDAPARSAGDVAALIYTSGSTGAPKGVMMEHRGIINTVLEFNRWCDVDHRSSVLQFASISFDAALLEMSMAFVSGAALVVAGRDIIENTTRFTEYLTWNRVTFGILPPVYLGMLARHPLPTLRTLVTAGEAPDADLARHYAKQKRYINAYGPAECSVCVSMYVVDPDADYTNGVPIGAPLQNTQVVITDAALNPVPVGAVGEICVMGAGVSRGYIGKPELTAERFVVHPQLGRLYRTGDLARRLDDGALQFMGRRDDQIKVRGQRVEPEEVRRRLLDHEAVEAAAVVDRQASHGSKELVAFVVTRAPVTTAELRDWLASTLTPAMLPAAIGLLERIPLTSNGKIDKNALRQLPLSPESSGAEEQQPMTENERVLVTVFTEVLGLPGVGLHDNYFALGGDSIKAIRIASKLRQLAFRMDVKQLFIYPTIAELSRHVRREERTIDVGPAIGPVTPGPIQAWFAERITAAHRSHFNNAVMLSAADGEVISEIALRQALRAVIQHHDSLRLRFRDEPGGSVSLAYGDVEIGDEVAASLRVLNLLREPAWRDRLNVEAEAVQRSMDLEQGHLVRAALARTPMGDRLLIVVHHLAIDAVSWRMLIEDLATVYQQAAAGQAIKLIAKTSPYSAWSERMRAYAESETGASERAYWESVHREMETIRRLGRGGARSKNGDSMSVRFALSRGETEQLLTEAHAAYKAQPNDILLAALGRAFKAWRGSARTAIALEGHGREQELTGDIDVSRTIGWFTSLYPVVLNLAEQGDIGYHIRQVKEALRAVPKNGAGYGPLRYTQPRTHLQMHEPQVSFNFISDSDSSSYPAPFAHASEPTGTAFSLLAQRLFDVDFLLSIEDRCLQVEINYDAHAFEQAEMEKLAAHYRSELLAVAAHCLEQEVTTLSPSDIDYSGLSIDELDMVLQAVGE